jgi:hypothetical protein
MVKHILKVNGNNNLETEGVRDCEMYCTNS